MVKTLEKIKRENAPSPNLYEPVGKNTNIYPILNIATRLSQDGEYDVIFLGDKDEISKLKKYEIDEIQTKIKENVKEKYNINDNSKIRLPSTDYKSSTEAKENIILRRGVFLEKNPEFLPSKYIPKLFEVNGKDMEDPEDFIYMYENVEEFRNWIDHMWGDMYLKEEMIGNKLSELQKQFIRQSYTSRCGNTSDSNSSKVYPSEHNAQNNGYNCCSLFPSGFMAHEAGTGHGLGIFTGNDTKGVCAYSFKKNPSKIKSKPEDWELTNRYKQVFPDDSEDEELKKEISDARACNTLSEKGDLSDEEKTKLESCKQNFTRKAKQSFFNLIDTVKRTRSIYKREGNHTLKLYKEVSKRVPSHLQPFIPTYYALSKENKIVRTKTAREINKTLMPLKNKASKLRRQLSTMRGRETQRIRNRNSTLEQRAKAKKKERASLDKKLKSAEKKVTGIREGIEKKETELETIQKEIESLEEEREKKVKEAASEKFRNTNGTQKSVISKMLNWASPFFDLNAQKVAAVKREEEQVLEFLKKKEGLPPSNSTATGRRRGGANKTRKIKTN